MGDLEIVAQQVNPNYCTYFKDCGYPTQIDGIPTEIPAKEMIRFGREDPAEYLVIAYFGEEPSAVRYVGDAEQMRKTIGLLGIRRAWPQNLGEKVFHEFRSALRDCHEGGVIALEQKVRPGKELQFAFILRKLGEIYSRQAASNSTLPIGT